MQHFTIFALLCAAIVSFLAERAAHNSRFSTPAFWGLLAGAGVLLAAYLWN
jgi:hypothetical protein